MTVHTLPTPIVSVAWLAEHLGAAGLGAPRVRVIDASMYLPNAGRDARVEYQTAHIPGSVFCDIGWISDETAPFPHTLPSAAVFAQRIGSIGVGSTDAIVVYDSSGQNYSAPRVWWMLRTFGHERVAVLDGGLPKWIADGHATTADATVIVPATFAAQLNSSRVRDVQAMRRNVASPNDQVVDARSPGRFEATEPEPRAGVRGGHIPHSVNVHYATLVHADGTMRSADDLGRIMADAHLDLTKPITASCGTGVTACAVILALESIGVTNTAVYDGSWTEWGSLPDTPIDTGPAT